MTDQYADDFNDEDAPPSAGSMVVAAGMSDKQIEKTFETGRLRVVQEKNDLFLSHVIQFIGGSGDGIWSNLRPEYQRRLRWDIKKKSKLIESFIMNIPVPPVFLYEKDLGRFEVMDGQQRLNTIAEFFGNKFSLEGLEIWEALNTRNYSTLPPLVRRGLDRAKISAITLMSDNSSEKKDSLDLRAQVFERLNRGGERLNQQELRNSLYSGSFNSLIISLSGLRAFTDAWAIPSHEENTLADGSLAPELVENILFKRMADVEIVLRFFAFRGPKKLSGSVRAMLDETMKQWRNLDSPAIEALRVEFQNALELCTKIFGEDAFRLPRQSPDKLGKLSRPLYDAEMIAMFHLREHGELLKENRDAIHAGVLALAVPGGASYELMVGRGNTAATIEDRISAVESVIKAIIHV